MSDADRIRRLLSVLFAMALVAACSVEPGASLDAAETSFIEPTASAAAPTASAPPSTAPTDPAMASPGASQGTSGRPTISPWDAAHADPSLEGLLPARIGDVELIRWSVDGADLVTGGDICGIDCLLIGDGVGAEMNDVTLAAAYDAPLSYALGAYRVAGASGAELLARRLALLESEPPYPMVGEFPVGDDTVTVAIRSWFPNDTQYLVVRDDALIVILFVTPIHDGAEPTLPPEVATIVAALP